MSQCGAAFFSIFNSSSDDVVYNQGIVGPTGGAAVARGLFGRLLCGLFVGLLGGLLGQLLGQAHGGLDGNTDVLVKVLGVVQHELLEGALFVLAGFLVVPGAVLLALVAVLRLLAAILGIELIIVVVVVVVAAVPLGLIGGLLGRLLGHAHGSLSWNTDLVGFLLAEVRGAP